MKNLLLALILLSGCSVKSTPTYSEEYYIIDINTLAKCYPDIEKQTKELVKLITDNHYALRITVYGANMCVRRNSK